MGESEARFVQIGEAAALCVLSRTVLRRMVAEGRLRAWRTPGKHLRFSRSDCLEFARSLGRVDLEDDETYLVGRAPVSTETAGSR